MPLRDAGLGEVEFVAARRRGRVIVVLGRPELDERGSAHSATGRVAAAAAAGGAEVELVGSVTDDGAGDATITELGRDGDRPCRAVAHADDRRAASGRCRHRARPALRQRLSRPGRRRATRRRGARCGHRRSARITEPSSSSPRRWPRAPRAQLPEDATVLAPPDEDEGAFADLVGRYAAQLDAGRGAADAWRDAITATGWEETAQDEPTTDEQ